MMNINQPTIDVHRDQSHYAMATLQCADDVQGCKCEVAAAIYFVESSARDICVTATFLYQFYPWRIDSLLSLQQQRPQLCYNYSKKYRVPRPVFGPPALRPSAVLAIDHWRGVWRCDVVHE
jgi:hypothetical protein